MNIRNNPVNNESAVNQKNQSSGTVQTENKKLENKKLENKKLENKELENKKTVKKDGQAATGKTAKTSADRGNKINSEHKLSSINEQNQAQDDSIGAFAEESVIQKYDETSESSVNNTLEMANKKLKPANSEILYSFHEPTRTISFKVINKDTGEVIREIPPEKILNMLEKLWELAGILIDEKM